VQCATNKVERERNLRTPSRLSFTSFRLVIRSTVGHEPFAKIGRVIGTRVERRFEAGHLVATRMVWAMGREQFRILLNITEFAYST
jgi:hypothetical protein